VGVGVGVGVKVGVGVLTKLGVGVVMMVGESGVIRVDVGVVVGSGITNAGLGGSNVDRSTVLVIMVTATPKNIMAEIGPNFTLPMPLAISDGTLWLLLVIVSILTNHVQELSK